MRALVALACVVALSACTAGHARRAAPSSPTTAPRYVATARAGETELDVNSVRFQAAKWRPPMPPHCVAITLMFKNVGHTTTTVPSADFLTMSLTDQTGPITDTDETNGTVTRQALPEYLSGCISLSRAELPPGVMPSHRVPNVPSNITLSPGASSHPITIYFAIQNPINQTLSLSWRSVYELGLQ